MQRYVVKDDLKLDTSDIRHIINVMRMNINDQFEMLNRNVIYKCKIVSINKNDFKYEIIKKEELVNNKTYKVIIACSLIKEQKMDYLLQKSTELGVDEIIPLITERTIVKINKKDNKINRWGRIIKESCEQCHRNDVPIINEIINLKDIVKYKKDINILCNTTEMSKNIKKVLQDSTKRDIILIVVGPEGGFSNKEVEYLIKNGFTSTTLGKNVLRAETVPLYILSVINYEFL